MAEGGITPVDDAPEVVGRDLGGRDVEGKDVKGELGKWQILPALPTGRLRDLLGDVQAAVGGKALEHDVFERQLWTRKSATFNGWDSGATLNELRREGI